MPTMKERERESAELVLQVACPSTISCHANGGLFNDVQWLKGVF